MEQSTLLKNRGCCARPANVRATSIASVLRSSPEDDDGEGPYIDLEFSIPEQDGESDAASGSDDDDVISESLRSEDPSDDLFFKGHSSLLFTPSSKPQLPSFLKSATKFRVFMLRFKKPKSPRLENKVFSSPKKQKQNNNNKFSVKLKVEEVPIVSLFTRDSRHSRSSNSSSARSAKLYAEESMQSPASTSDEKKNPKDVIHKYLSKIKPLYVRASKRYSDKLRFSGQLTAGDPEKSSHSTLRIVSKGLRKSRSASAAVAAVRSPPRRRDDSLIQQEDGIQSAIAFCKRSFNAGKGSDLGLARSMSDPGAERCD